MWKGVGRIMVKVVGLEGGVEGLMWEERKEKRVG